MTHYYAGIGSRETPENILNEMHAVAVELQQRGLILRSGGAAGADTAFEKGAGVKKEIFYASDCTPEAEAIAASFHPAWHRCGSHARKLLGRNSFQILGRALDQPVDFVMCWTPDGEDSGGTGNAIRHAWSLRIHVINMHATDWRKELNEVLEDLA